MFGPWIEAYDWLLRHRPRRIFSKPRLTFLSIHCKSEHTLPPAAADCLVGRHLCPLPDHDRLHPALPSARPSIR